MKRGRIDLAEVLWQSSNPYKDGRSLGDQWLDAKGKQRVEGPEMHRGRRVCSLCTYTHARCLKRNVFINRQSNTLPYCLADLSLFTDARLVGSGGLAADAAISVVQQGPFAACSASASSPASSKQQRPPCLLHWTAPCRHCHSAGQMHVLAQLPSGSFSAELSSMQMAAAKRA